MAITNKTGKQYYASQKKSDLKDSNALYDNQVKSTNKDYDTQVFEQSRAYEDQYRENAVQKEINKRQVAESMANLGLTDSGLNRTQQTAVQLSYGNNKANIDRQRQSGIDSLNYSRRQALDTTEQNRLAANAQIEQGYAEKAAAYDENRKTEAKNMVLSYLELGAEPPKDMIALSGISDSELKAYRNYYKKAVKVTAKNNSSGGSNKTKNDTEENSYVIKTNGSNLLKGMKGDLSGNNVTVTAIVKDKVTTGYKYTDNTSHKSTTFSVGVNPFTGDNNLDSKTSVGYAGQTYGYFDNGYQPRGVKGYGAFSKTKNGYTESVGKVPINEREQNVFKTTEGGTRYWVWDRDNNKYVEYTPEGKDSNGDTIWKKVK
ncbi:MAG: hypothetical protein IJD45_08165 [Clostridia bacterium]|nr:hypothetical protein [Clostridia bacterium]